jgi:hypothetical protein
MTDEFECPHRSAFVTAAEWYCPDCGDYEELSPETELVTIGAELF